MLSLARSLAILIAFSSLTTLAAEREWQGLPLSEYIRHLADQGLDVIYSNDLVRSDFIVTVEPTNSKPIDSLGEALKPYGLTISAGPAESWLIIRDPAALTITPAARGAEDTETSQQTLPNIVVSSSVYSIRYQKAGSHAFIDRNFMTALPDIGEETLRSLDRLPGVASGGISTRSHVRGGASNEQLLVFDGVRLYEPYHLKDFHTIATTIDQSAVDGVDFYTAGYPARYGDRMSGVVEMGIREPANDMETELGFSFLNTWALSTGRFATAGKGDWLVTARRSNLDLITRAFRPEYGEPSFFDVLSHVGWQLTDRTYVTANYLYSYDHVEIAQEDGSEQATARYRNRVGWAKAETDWSSSTSSSTIFSISDIANTRNGQSNLPEVIAGVVDDSRKFRVYALTQDWRVDVNEAWSLRAGFDIKDLDAHYEYESTLAIFPPFDQLFDNTPLQQRSIALAPSGEQYATYLEARWQATSNLILDMGLRWDRQSYSSSDNNEQRSPRLNALYKLGDDTEFRVGAGRFYQAQEINELQVNDGLSDFFPPQYSDHFVASFVHRFGSGLNLRAEYYQKDYESPMPRFENVFDSLVLIPELQIDRVQVVAEKAFVKGAEITLSGGSSANGLLWWAGYVWSSTEDKVAETDVRRSWDQKHSIKAGINTKWGAWDVSAAGTWHSGWPETQRVVETVLAPDGSSELVATTTPRNSLNYAAFHTLDARASRTFQLSKSELTTFIEVSNLYNRRNQCCTQYTVEVGDDGSRSVKANRSNWLPIVPSVGVVWRF